MNELEQINQQLQNINTKRVQYQTLIDQAKKQCQEIEQKYNVNSLQELEQLMNDAQKKYDEQIQKAKLYIEDANKILNEFPGVL